MRDSKPSFVITVREHLDSVQFASAADAQSQHHAIKPKVRYVASRQTYTLLITDVYSRQDRVVRTWAALGGCQGAAAPLCPPTCPPVAPTCQNNDFGALQGFSIFCKKQLNVLKFLVENKLSTECLIPIID